MTPARMIPPWRIAAWVLLILMLTGLVIVPLARLLAVAVEDGGAALGDALGGAAGRAIINTVAVAVTVTLLALSGGLAAALAVARLGPRSRQLVEVGLLVPLFVPPFVTALGWLRAYGPAALLDDAWGIEIPGLIGPLGIVVLLTVSAVPLAYLVVAAGLATRAEPDLERAARVHGATGLTAFRTVTLPLLRPSLLGAAALIFATSVNAFGVPAVLGIPAGFTVVTTRIYRDLALSADPAAFQRVVVLAALLVVICLAAVVPADAGRSRQARSGGGGGPRVPVRGSLGLALILGGYVLVTAIVPLGALLLTALTRAVGVPPTPANWTLDNFAEALTGRAWPAMLNSLVLAIVAASAVVALGAFAAGLARGSRGRLLGPAVLVGFALPGSAVALGVLLTFGGLLRDTLLLILLAYLAKFWALGMRPIAGGVDRLPADLLRAARTSGASALTAMRTVAAPVLAPVLGAAWALAFLFSLHELTMSSLLYGPGSETLAVVVLNLQQLGDPTVTAALAVLLTLLVFAAALPLRRWRQLGRPVPGLE